MRKSLFISVCALGFGSICGSSQASFHGRKNNLDKGRNLAKVIHHSYEPGPRSSIKKLFVTVHGEGSSGDVVSGRYGEINDVVREMMQPFKKAETSKPTSSSEAVLSQSLAVQEKVRDAIVDFLVDHNLDHLTATLSDGNQAPFPVWHVFRTDKRALTGQQNIGVSVGTEKDTVHGWTYDSTGKKMIGHQDLTKQPASNGIKVAPALKQQ